MSEMPVQGSYNPLLKSYPDSDKVNAVSIGAETLFTRLIAACDDNSRYYGDSKLVLGKLYTIRWAKKEVSEKDIECWLSELNTVGLIARFTTNSGDKFLEIKNSRKSLRGDIKPDIRFPTCDITLENTCTCEIVHNSVTDTLRSRNGNGPPTQPNPTQPNQTEEGESPPRSADALSPTNGHPIVRGIEDLPEGFAAFWSSWPRHFRKTGRKECLRRWKRDRLEPIAAAVLESLTHSKNSADWKEENGKFIPMPITWLGRTPWETEQSELIDLPSEQDARDAELKRLLEIQ